MFEAAPDVGGRTHTLAASELGVRIDAGATSIFSGNHYLVSFIERFGLTRAVDSGKSVLGLWDGNDLRFQWPDDALLPARLVERYGLSPARVIGSIKAAVANLNQIYDQQAKNVSYARPSDLFEALGLRNLTQISAYDFLERNLSITPKFVEEFVDAGSRDNYGQDGAINAFVDLVSLAGAGIGGMRPPPPHAVRLARDGGLTQAEWHPTAWQTLSSRCKTARRRWWRRCFTASPTLTCAPARPLPLCRP